MGNLFLSVNIIGGIWDAISGLVSGVGSYLATNFVPVADAAWTATAGLVSSIPAFCVAHPGAIVFGAVGLIAGAKLVKTAVRGIRKLFKSVKSTVKGIFAKDNMACAPAPQAVKEKSAEPAKAPAKAPAKGASKDKSMPAPSLVQSYMMNMANSDNLSGYRDFRQQKAKVNANDYILTNNNPLYSGYHTPTMSEGRSIAPMSMDDEFVMERVMER